MEAEATKNKTSSADPIEELESMLMTMARNIVDRPDDITIYPAVPARGSSFVAFEVHCDEKDVGALIGRRGTHAEAMRLLLTAAASTKGMRATVQFLSRDGERLARR